MMKPQPIAFGFILLSTFFPILANPQEIFSIPLEPTFFEEVNNTFPEGVEIDPEWLSFEIDPNIHLYREASLTITFIDEDAALKNQLGYFLFEDLDEDDHIAEEEITLKKIIFNNASKQGSGGNLRTGDSVRLGPFPAGTNLGFFLVADGYVQAKDTYYTLDDLNPNSERHLAMAALSDWGHVVLGIEDLPLNFSDKDFNDLLFIFTADPKEALEEFIEDSNIPIRTGLVPTPGMAEESGGPEETLIPGRRPSALLEGAGTTCRLNSRSPSSPPFSPLGVIALSYLLTLIGWRFFQNSLN